VVGNNIDYNDIDQGYLGDCYYLSALSSLAENDYRLKNVMLTQTVNKAGVFVA
jgi:calpain-15